MVRTLPDNIVPNGLYTPKETWSLLGISKTSLYKYDHKGSIKHETRDENGRRMYRGAAIIKFFHG